MKINFDNSKKVSERSRQALQRRYTFRSDKPLRARTAN